MKHPWRPPASSRILPFNKFNKDERSGRNRWLKYVTGPHLEWLMDTVDRQRRGIRMNKEDSEHYNIIKAQAEEFMAEAMEQRWTDADKRDRSLALDDEAPMAGR